MAPAPPPPPSNGSQVTATAPRPPAGAANELGTADAARRSLSHNLAANMRASLLGDPAALAVEDRINQQRNRDDFEATKAQLRMEAMQGSTFSS